MEIPATQVPAAIRTEYRGVLFRSKLEARWAVFFDTLGIPWEYEPRLYELPGRWYRPDFLISVKGGGWPGTGRWRRSARVWCEVKYEGISEREGEHITRLRLLAEQTGTAAVLLSGRPRHRLYPVFMPGMHWDVSGQAYFRAKDPKLELRR
jgi:hypothetical protein